MVGHFDPAAVGMTVRELLYAGIVNPRRPSAEAISDKDELIADLGADSLDRVELSISLEEEFKIEFSDDDVEGFRLVGDVVQAVLRKLGGPQAAAA